jgi:hypothetical protein
MKIMAWLATLGCVVILCSGQTLASDTEDLTDMLQEFLAASGEEAAHASFWAEDLVYTSSAGLRFGKGDIMAGFDSPDTEEEPSDGAPPMVYSGEDVEIRLYGDTAIVAFKLVGTPTNKSADADVLYYYNTGTFLKSDGVWKVVAWQATKIPPP